MNNLTVIILNDYCHVNGGASKVAIDEAVGLAQAGIRVIFIGACTPIAAELKQGNIEVICLGQTELINAGRNPLIMLQGLWNFKAARAVRDLLRSLDKSNTVIHLHGYTKALTTSPVRVAAKLGFKVVCTLHDFFPACPNGALFDYVKCTPCPKKAMSFDCIKTQCDKRHYVHKIYRVVRGAVQKYIGLFPGAVKDYIYLSNKSVELLRPYLPDGAKYFALENPIPVEKQEKVNAAANRDIVFVGRLDAEKGIEMLLQAVKKAGLKITLVGDGALRSLAESYDNCRLTGWVSSQQVQEELKKARVLVFPSLWYETYGLVVAEAAAKGIPAIVSDISAAAERVENGKTGWHLRSGDVEDSVRILRLTQDDEAVAKAGAAAYEAFWANPPVTERHIENLQNIYNKVLAS